MTYTSDDIKVIRGLGIIRKRPQMFFEESGRGICHYLLKSVLESMVDEAFGCNASTVRLKALPIGGVRFNYDGHGQRLDLSERTQGPFQQSRVYEAIMRFNGGYEDREVAELGHLRKIGPYLAAMSEELTIVSRFEGEAYSVSFEYGAVSSMLTACSDISDENEVYIRFAPELLAEGDIRDDELLALISAAQAMYPKVQFEQS